MVVRALFRSPVPVHAGRARNCISAVWCSPKLKKFPFGDLPKAHFTEDPHQKVRYTEDRVIEFLNLNPGACRRIAAAVDSSTAAEWNDARENIETETVVLNMAEVPSPTRRQLLRLHIRSAVPFFGFGFFDNMIMLTVGGAIENTICVACALSSLAAAGMGQMVSDAAGITLQGLIERFADKLGLPHPGLTLQQQQLKKVQTIMLTSRIFGIVIGCSFGMFPLLLLPEAPRQPITDQIAQTLEPQTREEFAAEVDTRTFKKGDVILHYGDLSNYVLFIEAGQVQCNGRDADHQEFEICTIEAGHSFGKPQLHCQSHVDLIALSDETVVQYIEKEAFLRLSGQKGMKVWEDTQQSEHTVYFKGLGHQAEQQIGEETMHLFVSLPDKDKVKVLSYANVPGVERFKGHADEGKCKAFWQLDLEIQQKALRSWHSWKWPDEPTFEQVAPHGA